MNRQEIKLHDSSIATTSIVLEHLTDFIPDGEIVTIGDTAYNYDKRGVNNFHWVTNNDPSDGDNDGPLENVPEPLRARIIEDTIKAYLLKTYGGQCKHADRERRFMAICYLLMPDNFLLRRYKAKFDEWHVGDDEVKVMLFRSALRVGYHNHSSLVHNNITGDTRGGKSDLATKFLTFIPETHKLILHSSSPTGVFYLTKKQDSSTRQITVNPKYYDGKIIAVLEAAEDSDKNFAALKAIAEETEETPARIVTIKGEAIKLQIKGSRSVLLTSVHGSLDEQVLKRFMHSSVSPNTEENRALKIDKLVENYLKSKDISDEEEVKIINDALDLLLNGDGVVFDITDEARRLITELPRLFGRSGYSTTHVNQFLTLCQTTAFEKRFVRNGAAFNTAPCMITCEDIQEAWHIVNRAEGQTKSVLTENELRILEQIQYFSKEVIELDTNETDGRTAYYRDYPTQRDISKATELSRATVSRALHPKPDNEGKLGKLLELNYVDYNTYKVYFYDDKETRWDAEIRYTGFELTNLGESVLNKSAQSITVDDKTYSPKDPLGAGLVYDTGTVNTAEYVNAMPVSQFHGSFMTHETHKSTQSVPNVKIIHNNDILDYEFHSFIISYIRDTLTKGEYTAPHIQPETVKLCNSQNEKSDIEEITQNEEHRDAQSSFIPHETGMKLRNSQGIGPAAINIARSAIEFLTSLKHSGACNGQDREYIKEELWRYLKQFYSREESFDLLDKFVQDKKIAVLIEEIHMERSHAEGEDEDAEHVTTHSVRDSGA